MNKIFGTLGIAILIAAAAVTFSHAWPSEVINQWQSVMMGDKTYFPALTICIIALPPLLLLLLIKKALQTFGKK
ncbi:MAG: hypothetical protein U0V75_04050 [Ferruginibacter sp.]